MVGSAEPQVPALHVPGALPADARLAGVLLADADLARRMAVVPARPADAVDADLARLAGVDGAHHLHGLRGESPQAEPQTLERLRLPHAHGACLARYHAY